jgi:hypothetical protein
MILRAGNLVYRVIEIDSPGEGLRAWKVAAVVVEQASATQIKLKTHFHGLFRTRFHPSEYNLVFHETLLGAIQRFLTAQREEIAALERRRAEAGNDLALALTDKHIARCVRAIAWATSQEGMAS